jgi:hypothetical protein
VAKPTQADTGIEPGMLELYVSIISIAWRGGWLTYLRTSGDASDIETEQKDVCRYGKRLMKCRYKHSVELLEQDLG